jgi:hypothetical protein
MDGTLSKYWIPLELVALRVAFSVLIQRFVHSTSCLRVSDVIQLKSLQARVTIYYEAIWRAMQSHIPRPPITYMYACSTCSITKCTNAARRHD